MALCGGRPRKAWAERLSAQRQAMARCEIEALEVAEKEHAEVDAGGHPRPSEVLGIVGAAQILNEGLEARLVEQGY